MIVFINGLYSGVFLPPKQLLYQFVLLLLYIACDWPLVHRLFRALLRAVVFLNAYWILGLVAGVDFIDMVQFNLRIVHLLLLSVYFTGSLDTVALISDSRRILRYRFMNSVYFYILSTMLFLKGYQSSYRNCSRQPRPHNLEHILQRWFGALSDNFAQAGQIGDRVTLLLHQNCEPRSFLTSANTLVIIYLAVSMVTYGL